MFSTPDHSAYKLLATMTRTSPSTLFTRSAADEPHVCHVSIANSISRRELIDQARPMRMCTRQGTNLLIDPNYLYQSAPKSIHFQALITSRFRWF
jgi:hypothetical protein